MSQARLQSPCAPVLAAPLTSFFLVPSALLCAASMALVLASLMDPGGVLVSGQRHPDPDVRHGLHAQELALVMQQPGGAPPPSLTGGSRQRTCAAVQCPLVALPVGALFPVWRQAELCIQETYSGAHQENVVSRNKEWLSYTGIRPEEVSALRCLKKEGFTGKSGMAHSEPDLWDFTERTMYEITTPSGMAFRRGKLAAELALANEICSKMECGGVTFRPLLLGMTQLAGSALPTSDVTVQTLRNALEAKKAGSGNNADGGRSGGSIAAPPESERTSTSLWEALAFIVRLGDYSPVDEGKLYFQSERDEVKTGSTLTKPLLTILGGKRLAALVTFKVTGTGDDWVQVMILGSSVWVDADQNPWGKVDELVSNKPVRLFWYGAQKK